MPAESVERMTNGDPNVPTAPLDEFVAAYEDDDNWWWRIACGHHQNLFEAAVERLTELRHHHVAVWHDVIWSDQWLAICRECTPVQPGPFGLDEVECRRWAQAHEEGTKNLPEGLRDG